MDCAAGAAAGRSVCARLLVCLESGAWAGECDQPRGRSRWEAQCDAARCLAVSEDGQAKRCCKVGVVAGRRALLPLTDEWCDALAELGDRSVRLGAAEGELCATLAAARLALRGGVAAAAGDQGASGNTRVAVMLCSPTLGERSSGEGGREAVVAAARALKHAGAGAVDFVHFGEELSGYDCGTLFAAAEAANGVAAVAMPRQDAADLAEERAAALRAARDAASLALRRHDSALVSWLCEESGLLADGIAPNALAALWRDKLGFCAPEEVCAPEEMCSQLLREEEEQGGADGKVTGRASWHAPHPPPPLPPPQQAGSAKEGTQLPPASPHAAGGINVHIHTSAAGRCGLDAALLDRAGCSVGEAAFELQVPVGGGVSYTMQEIGRIATALMTPLAEIRAGRMCVECGAPPLGPRLRAQRGQGRLVVSLGLQGDVGLLWTPQDGAGGNEVAVVRADIRERDNLDLKPEQRVAIRPVPEDPSGRAFVVEPRLMPLTSNARQKQWFWLQCPERDLERNKRILKAFNMLMMEPPTLSEAMGGIDEWRLEPLRHLVFAAPAVLPRRPRSRPDVAMIGATARGTTQQRLALPAPRAVSQASAHITAGAERGGALSAANSAARGQPAGRSSEESFDALKSQFHARRAERQRQRQARQLLSPDIADGDKGEAAPVTQDELEEENAGVASVVATPSRPRVRTADFQEMRGFLGPTPRRTPRRTPLRIAAPSPSPLTVPAAPTAGVAPTASATPISSPCPSKGVGAPPLTPSAQKAEPPRRPKSGTRVTAANLFDLLR